MDDVVLPKQLFDQNLFYLREYSKLCWDVANSDDVTYIRKLDGFIKRLESFKK